MTEREQSLQMAIATVGQNRVMPNPDEIIEVAKKYEGFLTGRHTCPDGFVPVDRKVIDYFAGRDCDEGARHVVYDTATDTFIAGPDIAVPQAEAA